MQSTDSSITVCIVTHRRPELLGRLLDCLATCRIPTDFRGTLIVENGGCEDSRVVVERAAEQLAARYLVCDSKLKSSALNLALRQADDGLMLFIDDDALPSANWLVTYHDAYVHYGSGHYFGGSTDCHYEQRPPAWLRRFLPASATGLSLSGDGPPDPPCSFLGFNWAAEVTALRACGGFSTDFGPGTDLGGGEESFMQLRLLEAGLTAVNLKHAMVTHYVPPARCSPEWSLRHAYAGGVCRGIAYEHYQRRHRLPIRRLRATIKHVLRTTMWTDVLSLCLLRPRGRYWLRHCWDSERGFCNGISRGAMQKPLTTERWMSRGLGVPAVEALEPVAGH